MGWGETKGKFKINGYLPQELLNMVIRWPDIINTLAGLGGGGGVGGGGGESGMGGGRSWQLKAEKSHFRFKEERNRARPDCHSLVFPQLF